MSMYLSTYLPISSFSLPLDPTVILLRPSPTTMPSPPASARPPFGHRIDTEHRVCDHPSFRVSSIHPPLSPPPPFLPPRPLSAHGRARTTRTVFPCLLPPPPPSPPVPREGDSPCTSPSHPHHVPTTSPPRPSQGATSRPLRSGTRPCSMDRRPAGRDLESGIDSE